MLPWINKQGLSQYVACFEQVVNGQFSILLPVDTVFTISNQDIGTHDSYSSIPDSTNFPIPYKDDFQSTFCNGAAFEKICVCETTSSLLEQ